MEKIYKNQKGEAPITAIALVIVIITLVAVYAVGKYEKQRDHIIKSCINSCDTSVCIEQCKNIPSGKLEDLIDCTNYFTYKQCVEVQNGRQKKEKTNSKRME